MTMDQSISMCYVHLVSLIDVVTNMVSFFFVCVCLCSCWITTGHGTNWAFHGPVIAVLVVST